MDGASFRAVDGIAPGADFRLKTGCDSVYNMGCLSWATGFFRPAGHKVVSADNAGKNGCAGASGEGVVDPLSRKLLQELEEMQQRTGRMLRNMSMSRMLNMDSGAALPPMDIYESEREFIVYADLAGVDSESFSVLVEGHQVRIFGRRNLPPHKDIACVHQLEIEAGAFDRTVNLPGAVDVEAVTSSYTNGILRIILPKKAARGRINIAISNGGQ